MEKERLFFSKHRHSAFNFNLRYPVVFYGNARYGLRSQAIKIKATHAIVINFM
jgi:hypothetical protein